MFIDFQVTSRCHLNCKYCFDILKGQADKNESDLKRSIKKLKQSGVDGLVVTGGEPLLRNDIINILQYIKKNEMYLYLSTQGYFIEKITPEIIQIIDCFGLPLDSIDDNVNIKLGRMKNQQEIFDKAYRYIRKYNKKCNIKLGTVVNRYNVDGIDDLAELINNNYSDVTWRLYEFNPLGNGLTNIDKLKITSNEFNKIITKLKEMYNNLNISPMRIIDAENGYFFISPQMELLVFEKTNYKNLGYLDDMTSNDVKKYLFNDYNNIANKIKKNRNWVKGDSK